MDRILFNQLAWKSNTPWHGKGIQAPADATGEQMLELAGLNYTVEKVPIMVPGSSVEQSATYHAIVRGDTRQVYTVTRDRYNVVQNAQIVDFFREYCEAGEATMETVGAIDGGSKIWALARLTGADKKLQGRTPGGQLAKGEELRGYMLLASSHDMTLQHVAKPTQVCVVCWNTLSGALNLGGGRLGKKDENEFRAKHSRKWTPSLISEAKKTMGIAIEKISLVNEMSATLAKVALDGEGRKEFIFHLLKPANSLDTFKADYKLTRVGEAIENAMIHGTGQELMTRRDTMWGAVNGVTYHVDHVRGKLQDTRLMSAWFGDGDALKSKAMQVAVQMAGVGI